MILPFNNFGGEWHLICCEAKGFFSNLRGNSLHLVNNSARFNNRNPEFWISLPRTHTGFCGFSRDRFIRKNSYPNLSATFHKPGNRDSPGFNLTRSKPVWFSRLKPVITECQFRSAIGLSFKISFHHLSMFNFFRA